MKQMASAWVMFEGEAWNTGLRCPRRASTTVDRGHTWEKVRQNPGIKVLPPRATRPETGSSSGNQRARQPALLRNSPTSTKLRREVEWEG